MEWTDELRKVFTDRAIEDSVRDARHRPYTDLDDVFEADPNYRDLTDGQKRWLDRLVGQSDGVVMVRHAPPITNTSGLLEPIFAELRPLHAVKTETRRHNFTDKNGKLWDHHTGSRPLTEAWKKHINRAVEPDDHHGINNPNDHTHTTTARYLFPPGVSKTVTRTWSDGTEHEIRVKDKTHSRAKRLDVHPAALALFDDAETVYFVLEGCLKADAVLSAVLRTGERASVFSVPSVTLWNCYQHGELSAFVQHYLRGRRVIIVPDSDWEDPTKDGAVISQALYCWTALREWGLAAEVAAPTPKADGTKRGIDDYLADGNALADMPIIDRRLPAGLGGWSGGEARRADGHARTTRLLAFLSLHATEGTAQFHAPLATIARHARIERKAVRDDLVRLVDAGAITSDKPLVLAEHRDQDGNRVPGRWIRWPNHNPYLEGGFYRDEMAWAETPTFTVARMLRSYTDRSRTVGEVPT